MPRFITTLAIVLLALVAPAKAQTQTLPTTDLLLVLAVDASGSVNQTRFELQRRGYADAFRSQQILNAIRGGSTGSIAVTMVQWTGPTMQVQVVPWTLIKDAGSALAFADAIVVTEDSVNMVTEAAGTGKPVYVQSLPGKSRRLSRFHQLMHERGATRPFEGKLEFWTYPPINDTEVVASAIRRALGLN